MERYGRVYFHNTIWYASKFAANSLTRMQSGHSSFSQLRTVAVIIIYNHINSTPVLNNAMDGKEAGFAPVRPP